MARKNASAHSDAQFALFVNQIGTMLDGEKKTTFEQIVRRLVCAVATDAGNGRDATAQDPMTELQHPAEPTERAWPLAAGGAGGRLPARPDFEAI